MRFLFDGPSPLEGLKLGTVVHLGAGPGDVLDAYDDLQWQRLVLVEGDPDTVTDLRAAVGARPDVEVLGQAVAPDAGTLVWHRYNLGSLNGPRDSSGLAVAFPRLRALATTPLAAVGIEALLQKNAPTAGGPNLLVIDLPGQEAQLLARVGGELLRRFEWVAVRSRGRILDGDGARGETSQGILQREGFRAVERDAAAADPLWSWSLMRFDPEAHRLKRLQEELAAMAAMRDALARELELRRAEAGTLARRIAELDEALGLSQRQLDAERVASGEARQDVQALLQRVSQADAMAASRQAEFAAADAEMRRALQVERETVARLKTELEAATQTKASEHEAATRKLNAERSARAEVAAELAACLHQLDAERAALGRATQEIQALRQHAAQAEQAAAARQAEFASTQTEMQRSLQLEHEAVTRLKAGLDAATLELDAERAACAKVAAELAERQRQHDAELTERQRQHDAELAERQHQHDAELAERQHQHDAELAERQHQHDAELAERQHQLDAERATLVKATQDAQAMQQRVTQAEQAAAARHAELAAVQAELQRERETAARLTAERDAVAQGLETERAAHAKAVADAEQRRRHLQADADAASARQAELTAALGAAQQEAARLREAQAQASADLQRQVDAMAEATRRHQDQLAQAAKERQASDGRFAERIKTLEDEAHTARQAATLSLKLQTLREADLEDLQSRYQVTLAQQQGQHELLAKLAQRLTLANRYFHELASAQQLPVSAPAVAAVPVQRKRRARAKPAPSAP